VPALLDDPSHRLAVVDQVMSRRVARWPIVNVLHVLLAPLTALWRRNLAPARGPDDAALVGAWVDAAGPLAGHVQAAFAILHQSHPGGAQLYRHRRLWEPMAAEESAEQLRRSLTRALGRQRQRAVERLAGRRGIVAPVIRFVLTIGAALWFPLLQPLAEALATGGIQRQWGEMAADLGLLAVRVFSAAYLLQAAAFLGLWYLTLWLILRWDTQRKVARLLERWRSAEAGETGEADASPPSAVIEWIEGLLEPARQSRQRADELVRRADELRQELASPAA
jgi:hypothetical protein